METGRSAIEKIEIGSILVTGIATFQANSKKRKNLVRTRLKVDFKAIFEEVAKLVRYGAGDGTQLEPPIISMVVSQLVPSYNS